MASIGSGIGEKMEERDKFHKQLVDDYSAVLKEAKSMGCDKIGALYNIPIENMELIVWALEKQIPKKVLNEKDTLFANCPNCGCVQNGVWNKTYCGDCGKKLDWSD